ncbi:energy transducer TonB [Candidatus Poribacteria bacterium]|nr:energy transducer TonB [Candidatus Poribacteria bacterium]
MSRSSGIVSQLHSRRAQRKKPKINAKLRKFSIDESQKGGIAAAKENKPPPLTVQKTGSRNSLSLIFSIGLHVAIAIILGTLYIKDRIEAQTERLEAAFLPNDVPDRKRVIVNKREKITFEAKEQEIEAPIKRTVVTNADLPKGPRDLTLPSSDNTNVLEGVELEAGPRISLPERTFKSPIQPKQSTSIPSTVLRPQQQNTPFADLDNSTPSDGGPDLTVPEINTSAGITRPVPKYAVKPTYPKNARRAEKEGKVYLKAVITVDGIAKDITAETDLGFGFEEAAIAALKKFKFTPAKENGKAIEYAIRIPFEFKLEDD